jgi:protocatechuate 3,4-dioxygenase beta subunit
MKPIQACLLWLLLTGTFLSAQDAPLSNSGSTSVHAATALLAGFVLKDPGGEPVKKALVELIAEDQGKGGNYTAVTGADGSFQIESVAPGRYHLYIERTGYLDADKHQSRAEGRVLTLAAGQELKEFSIRLQAAAVVEGRVTDEDGDPLPNAQVAVQRQTFVSGHRHWEQAGAATSDDLGNYRIANLAAGNYYVAVTPPPDFKSLIESTGEHASATRGAPDRTASTSYAPTYYPGTRDRGQASPIQLHAGDNFPANFSLTPAPSVIVRGTIANIPPGTTAVVTLQSKDFGMVLNGADVHRDGSFEVHDISPGSYTVFATVSGGATPMVARQALQVSSENTESLHLTPQPGASIHGRLRLENKGGYGGARVEGGQFFLALRSVDGDDDILGAISFGEGFATTARVAGDGSFEWKDVPPGHYYLQLADGSVGTWFLKSVAVSGREAGDTSVSVNGGSIALDLVASANGATIEGVVANAKGEAAANAVVVAVPEAHLRQRLDRFRKTLSDQSGRFTLRGLPPGQYILLAWESVDEGAYYNPEFIEGFAGQGKAIVVGEGEKKSMQVYVIPSAEDAAN